MAQSIDPARREAAGRALALDDELLARECEEEFFIASGPGGQHRNKTSSGVRLRHPPTGLTVTATERRSQAQNRGVAMLRLRAQLEALCFVAKKRRPTRPTLGSKKRRLESKKRQGEKKARRGRVD
jgi:ribosome-associated protein